MIASTYVVSYVPLNSDLVMLTAPIEEPSQVLIAWAVWIVL
jgi:hypothetical protein